VKYHEGSADEAIIMLEAVIEAHRNASWIAAKQ
jgi:hypothetical protein